MNMLNDSELTEIAEAVKKAESTTSGEIATAIIQESDSYAEYELAGGIIAGFFMFLLILAFLPGIESFLDSKLWDFSSFHLVVTSGVLIFLTIFVQYRILNLAFANRIIVPAKVRAQKVHRRGVVQFVESGVANTKDRTGILIFISLRERRVELIADLGISEKIDQKVWDEIVAQIIRAIRAKRLKEGLVEAVTRCGELLTEQFPIQKEDTNELPNKPAILEK